MAPHRAYEQSPGAAMIADEREVKQIMKHGFTGEHAAAHPEWYANGQLVEAAMVIASAEIDELYAPERWDHSWFQRLCQKSYVDRLVIAGAFLAAEIDRLKYLENVHKSNV